MRPPISTEQMTCSRRSRIIRLDMCRPTNGKRWRRAKISGLRPIAADCSARSTWHFRSSFCLCHGPGNDLCKKKINKKEEDTLESTQVWFRDIDFDLRNIVLTLFIQIYPK